LNWLLSWLSLGNMARDGTGIEWRGHLPCVLCHHHHRRCRRCETQNSISTQLVREVSLRRRDACCRCLRPRARIPRARRSTCKSTLPAAAPMFSRVQLACYEVQPRGRRHTAPTTATYVQAPDNVRPQGTGCSLSNFTYFAKDISVNYSTAHQDNFSAAGLAHARSCAISDTFTDTFPASNQRTLAGGCCAPSASGSQDFIMLGKQ